MSKIKQISIAFKTPEQMEEAYMPFLRHGGFFIPTEQPFNIGDELFIALTLPDNPDRRQPAAAKVVWINPPKVSGGRRPGIGVAFEGVQAQEINRRFAALVKQSTRRSSSPRNTM